MVEWANRPLLPRLASYELSQGPRSQVPGPRSQDQGARNISRQPFSEERMAQGHEGAHLLN
jgi:hypothetical protein